MKKEKDVISNIKELIEEEVISPYSTPDGRLLCDVAEKDEPLKQYELRNRELLMVIKGLLSKQGKNLPSTCYGELIDELEYVAYSNKLPYNLSKRCCYHDGIYMYDLNAEEGTSVCIDEEGMFEICTPEKTFFRTKTYASQVAPNWEVDSSELPFYLEKHFNLQDESSFLLMALYLVCAFLGCIISVPAVVLVGEKGSAKTTMLRRLEQIIDPKVTDLGGAPHSAKNMEIRLHNNYFCAFDNLSSKSINRSSSDILCRAVTGGTVSHRKLYSDSDEVVFNLKSIVAMNGISPMIHESDLADRILLFQVQRLDEKARMTERELNQRFEEDIPSILGCIFYLINDVLHDTEPITVEKKLRLTDFFEYAIKTGRALGYDDEVIADLLWENHREVNDHSLSESVVGQCVIEFLRERTEYTGSVSELLGEFKIIAEKCNIKLNLLPSTPNVLSRRLNEIRSNLESKHVFYSIRNIGSFRQIHIYKKQRHKKR